MPEKYTDLSMELEHSDYPELVQTIKDFWNEENVQKIFPEMPHNSLPDTTSYFFNHIERFGQENYTPTNEGIFLF